MTANPNSILDSTKKLLGVNPDDTSFDMDITIFINAALGRLQQLDVGPSGGMLITDNSSLWTDVTSAALLIGMVQQYVYLTVKMAFDPPATSFAIDAIQSMIAQHEWRIVSMAEAITPPLNPDGTPGPAGIPSNDAFSNVTWWVLTGLSDFPDGADVGDVGVDFDTNNLYYDTTRPASAYIWDITGLSDFPDGSVVGEWGVDNDTGDIWRRTG